jgi:hypothetical protein
MTKKSQADLEQVAKIYEQIRADNPPDLHSLIALSSSTEEVGGKAFPKKLEVDEVSDRCLWEDVISGKKLEISENILITAEKAKAIVISSSKDGDLYQFKGSEEWLTLEDYSETLLHQPFDDQLTHLFRFLLVEEFSKDLNLCSSTGYEEILEEIYFDQNEGFPSKFLFDKAMHPNYSLCLWKDKSWYEYDTGDSYIEKFSLKHLLDTGKLHENLKNKSYFDGLVNSLSVSIYESIKDFVNPYAEYETLCFYLIPFEGIISLTLIVEKLEKLGYKNKDFIMALSSDGERDLYVKKAKSLLRNFLQFDHPIENISSFSLRDLLINAGKFHSSSDPDLNSNKNNHSIEGLKLLLTLESEEALSKSNVIEMKDITDKSKQSEYSAFLPWWHATNQFMLTDKNLKGYQEQVNDIVNNRLTKNNKFYSKAINRAMEAFVPMRVLEDFNLNLANLPLNTPQEILLDRKKRKVWKEIDRTILNAYQYKISRSALSLKLQTIIQDNKPLLDKAARRLDQLLDLYESNIINN